MIIVSVDAKYPLSCHILLLTIIIIFTVSTDQQAHKSSHTGYS